MCGAQRRAGLTNAPKAEDGGDLRFEAGEGMIAAALDELPRAGIERDGYAVIEDFVAALHEQEIALRPADPADAHRAELVEMRRRDLEPRAGMEIGLNACMVAKIDVGPDGGVDDDRAHAVPF